MDIPSQFSPGALLGDAGRCLAFRCVVKRISHEENQQVRQKFNRHRSRLPALTNDGRYALAGARERFLQYLAVNHRTDLEKAGFTGKQIGQMADLRPFDPRADNVIWQVHHRSPFRSAVCSKIRTTSRISSFCPSTSIEPSYTANIWIDNSRVLNLVTGARLLSSSPLDASV